MLAARIVLAGMLAVPVFGLSACGKQRVDLAKAQTQLNAQLKAVGAAVDCPDRVDAGSSFDCTVTANGRRQAVRWKVAGKHGAELQPEDPRPTGA